MKEILKKHITTKGYTVIDVGTNSLDRCDYPDFGEKLGKEVQKDTTGKLLGVLVCGSGVGISIAANKIRGIRCALCHDHYTAKMAKSKDHCNVIALGGRVIGAEVAKEAVDTFIESAFETDPACLDRVEKIKQLEEKYLNN